MKLIIALQIFIDVVIPRRLTRMAGKDERGSNTLELAVIAGAVFLLAVGAVALIANAVNGNLAKIVGG
jgi:Flp pilus assembly pilin Flp